MNEKIKYVIFALLIIVFIVAVVLKVTLLSQNKVEEPKEVIINEGYIDDITPATGGSIRDNPDVSVISVPSGELKVYFFDVGQADAIFVQNNDSCMLIDAGNNPDGKYISKYLRKELGIKKIDYLIGTHPHEDHIGGLDIIIEDFDIGTFYMPDRSVDNKSYTDVVKYAKEKDLKILSPTVGTKFKIGTALCEVMTKNDNAEDINESSIVIEVNFGENKFLFTGDIESEAESSRRWNDVDVLKVSHHGSKYATGEGFLKQVKPEIAVIMCAKDNDYYYPHEAVLKRLENINCKDVYITSEEGTILLTSDGKNITEKSFPQLTFDGNKQ